MKSDDDCYSGHLSTSKLLFVCLSVTKSDLTVSFSRKFHFTKGPLFFSLLLLFLDLDHKDKNNK